MARIKICGLSTPDTLEAALTSGADMVGFVRFPRSPRHVDLGTGRLLSAQAAGRALRVLLVVDPGDRDLDLDLDAIEPDLIQLHGGETPERAAAIRTRTGRPVMKAIGIAAPADLSRIADYRGAADCMLLDAKAPAGAVLPGGNGVPFDWRVLAGAKLGPGDMVSGGLSPENVAQAILVSGARGVDVSSGVERRLGEKDSARIAAFLRSAKSAFADAAGPSKKAP